MTQTPDQIAAQVLARTFAAAERTCEREGVTPSESIRRHIAALKAEWPEVYELVVRHAATQIVLTLGVVDAA